MGQHSTPEPNAVVTQSIMRFEGEPPIPNRNGTARILPGEVPMLSWQRGAWGEAVASAWLMQHGYEVFQGIGSTSCDFIALRDGQMYRVEVKTCLHTKPGVKPGISGVYPERFDILLVVLGADRVLMNPTPDEVAGAYGSLKQGRGGNMGRRRQTIMQRYS